MKWIVLALVLSGCSHWNRVQDNLAARDIVNSMIWHE
jgi:hypothetical protein